MKLKNKKLFLIALIFIIFTIFFIKFSSNNSKSEFKSSDNVVTQTINPTQINVVYTSIIPTIVPTKVDPSVQITSKPTSQITPEPSKISTNNNLNQIDYINFKISKSNSIDKYKPNDLVIVSKNYTLRDIYVSKIILDDLYRLMEDSKKDGLELKIISGYRSFEDQNNIFNSYVKNEQNNGHSYDEAVRIANTYSAKPGHSEHQLGTTVDILSSENNYSFDTDQNYKYIEWLEKNSNKYNFKISYPKNNSEYIYEPWHLRWYP